MARYLADDQGKPTSPRRKRWPFVVTAGTALVVGAGIGAGSTVGVTGTEPLAAPAPITETVTAPPETVTETVTAPAETVTETVTVTEQAPPPEDTGPDAGAITAGMYLVGTDIPPGRYTTDGPADDLPCYWERATDASGEFDSIITNNIVPGPGSVTVNAGEFVTFNGSCTWTLVS